MDTFQQDFHIWISIILSQNDNMTILSGNDNMFQTILSQNDNMFQMILTENDNMFQTILSENDNMFQTILSQNDNMFQMNWSPDSNLQTLVLGVCPLDLIHGNFLALLYSQPIPVLKLRIQVNHSSLIISPLGGL